jgi:hypothetical protein
MRRAAQWGVTEAMRGKTSSRRYGVMVSRYEASPTPALASQLAQLAAIDLGDAQAAARYAAECDDETLKRTVPLLTKPTDALSPDEAAALADWCIKQSEGNVSDTTIQRMLQAAERSYRRAATVTDDNALRGRATAAAQNAQKKLDTAMGKRLAMRQVPTTKGTLYATCDFWCQVAVNGRQVLSVSKSEINSARIELKPGDVITAKLSNGAGTKGFWCMFKAEGGRGSFSTDARSWYAYQPAAGDSWWRISPDTRTMRCRQEKYVAGSFRAMIEKFTGHETNQNIIWGHDRSEDAHVYCVVK